MLLNRTTILIPTAFAIFIIGHTLYLNSHWINNEYIFAAATKSMMYPEFTRGMEQYWELQANPLGYSFIASLFTSVFGISNWSVRLPSLLAAISIFGVAWLCYRDYRERNDYLFFLWMMTVMMNPLFWIFSHQATADILPIGLMAIAFFCCYKAQHRLGIHLLGGICFSLAIITKFNAILMGLGFFYIIFIGERGKFQWEKKHGISFLFYTFFPATFLLIYFLIIYQLYDILFIAEKFKQIHFVGQLKNYFFYFGLYSSYFTLITGFLSLLAVLYLWKFLSRKKFILIAIVGILLTAAFSTLLVHTTGEMSFGQHFEIFLGTNIKIFIRISSFLSTFFLIYALIHYAISSQSKFASFLIWTVIPFLIISSSSRPAHRYLLFCLPLLSFFLIIHLGRQSIKATKWLSWLTLICFIPLTLVSIIYQTQQGKMAENMVQWTISHNYFKDTSPGAISHHAGYHFLTAPTGPKKFTIVSADSLRLQKNSPIEQKNYLHKESVILFGKEIVSYYLVKKNSF